MCRALFFLLSLCATSAWARKPVGFPAPARFEAASKEALAAGRQSDVPAEALRLTGEATAQDHSVAFTRGMALLRLGRFRAAAESLDQASQSAAAKDIVDFFAAEAYFHSGQVEIGCARYRAFGARHPTSSWRHRARFRVGDCLLAEGKAVAARAHLVKQLARYPEYPFKAAAWWTLADAEQAAGRPTEAAVWLRQLRKAYPHDPLAGPASARLTALAKGGINAPAQSPKDAFKLGYSLRRRKYLEQALVTLGTVVKHPDADTALRRKARYQMGRALLQLERFEDALKNFSKMAKQTRGKWRSRALYWKSRVLERLGRTQEASDTLVKARGAGAASAETQLKTGWVFFNGARYRKALDLFRAASKASKALRSKTVFWLTWISFRLKRYKTALKGFESLRRASKWRAARYAYWSGRAQVELGRRRAAKASYRWAIERAPTSYYAYQAAARLAETVAEEAAALKGAAAPAVPTADGGQGATKPKALPIKPSVVPVVSEPMAPLPALTPLRELASRWGGMFPALIEAYELAVGGERRWAALRLRRVSDELRRFRAAGRPRKWRFAREPYVDYRGKEKRAWEWGRRRGGPDRDAKSPGYRRDFLTKSLGKPFWRLMRDAFIAVDDQHYARRHALKADSPKGSPEGAHNANWRLRYPRAYRRIVEAAARRHRLDPYFIWALMTVESSYNPWAISRASARGLMQVMPHTGGLIGDRMAWRNFGTALLFEPEVVIEMAAWYFRQLLDKFNGQLPLAIASYNAGPHRVASWLGPKGHLPMDEFIEEIPYNEAREYTKKVLRYLALYRRIYEGASGFDVPQRIDTHYGDNINF